jgi:hypothetical protein
MSCCEQKAQLDTIYLPLNRRLVEFGKEVSGDPLMNIYPNTFLWVFTFYNEEDICEECQDKLGGINKWFSDYGMYTNPTRNLKWIIEEEPDKNLIYKELGFTKSPMHLFCDGDGKIIDIINGIPTTEWLEKHILSLYQRDTRIT